jgi:aryl-alcohol dehydrogenase-like predicted oxidoreductase
MHTPDPETPIDETLAALHELIDAGLVRYIGHSNFTAAQLLEADTAATEGEHPRFISAQNEYSLLVRDADAELIPAAVACGVGLLPYYPLHHGLLTGKFSRDGGPADTRIMRQRPQLVEQAPWDRIERFAALASERGLGMLEATIGWLLSRLALSSVIAGATSVEQIAQNTAAADAWHPTADELDLIDEMFTPGASTSA